VIEKWVLRVRKLSQQRVDWHYVGGRARILCLGDVARVHRVAEQLRGDIVADSVIFDLFEPKVA
jgi:hypothetical protein